MNLTRRIERLEWEALVKWAIAWLPEEYRERAEAALRRRPNQ